MASYNRVILVGNLTRDPELKYLNSGTAVTDLGLAINSFRKSPSGERTEETTFVDITFFGREAEIACEYLKKGSSALVEGRLKLDSWEKEGQKFSKLKVIGERLQLLGSRGESGQRGGYSQQGGKGYSQRPQTPSQQYSQDNYDDIDAGADDVPF